MPKTSQIAAVLDALWLQNEARLQRETNQSVKDFLCGRKDALNQVCGLVKMRGGGRKKDRKK